MNVFFKVFISFVLLFLMFLSCKDEHIEPKEFLKMIYYGYEDSYMRKGYSHVYLENDTVWINYYRDLTLIPYLKIPIWNIKNNSKDLFNGIVINTDTMDIPSIENDTILYKVKLLTASKDLLNSQYSSFSILLIMQPSYKNLREDFKNLHNNNFMSYYYLNEYKFNVCYIKIEKKSIKHFVKIIKDEIALGLYKDLW